jgi:hypothetical protein
LDTPYFQSLLTAITEEERFRNELIAAKQEFERVAGQIMETDHSYDGRINAFHNWYILDRPMTSTGVTPLEYYLQLNANSLPEEIAQGYRELADNIHSLFELVKSSGPRAILRDLMNRQKYRVEGAEQLDSMERGDLFNSRIFIHGGKTYLSNYLIVHPYPVTKLIRVEARKVRKAKENPKPFLFRLLFFHSRWEQFSQMDVNKIYRFEAFTGAQQAV